MGLEVDRGSRRKQKVDEDSMWKDVRLWKENIRECMKRIRQRPVRSGGSGGSSRTDRTMWVVRSDEDGDGRMKMGTNPDKGYQRCKNR